MKFDFCCACGARWKGDLPPKQIGKIRYVWKEVHSDPGCGPATPEEAAAARRKAEKEAEERQG